MNKTILTGVLFAEPVYIAQSKTNPNLSIAKFGIQVEWYKNTYTKIDIAVFNDKAKFVNDNLKKGDKVYIEAKLQSKTHNDKSWLDISVTYLEKLSSNNYVATRENGDQIEIKANNDTGVVLGSKESVPQQTGGLDLKTIPDKEEKPQQTQQEDTIESLSWLNENK